MMFGSVTLPRILFRTLSSSSSSSLIQRSTTSSACAHHCLQSSPAAAASPAAASSSIKSLSVLRTFTTNDGAITTNSTSTNKKNTFVKNKQDEMVIRDLFLSFAHDNDSTEKEPLLQIDDLRKLLKAIGDHPSEEQLTQLIKTVDADKSGTIDYREFLSGCDTILSSQTNNDQLLDIDAMTQTFRNLDKDGNGVLTLDELSGLLSATGAAQLSEEDASYIMSQADADKSNSIDLSEFINLLTNPKMSHYNWRIRSSFRVFLVMGGPGSGKGTLCDYLVHRANIYHYSSGDMLREEIKSKSLLATMIERYIKKGELLPSSTIIALLKKHLSDFPGSLVGLDGFPRNLENYKDFDAVCGPPEFALYIDVPDEVMVDRILQRGMTSGRADDNEETTMRRLKVFHEQTKPTLCALEQNGIPIYRVDGTLSVEEVWEQVLRYCPAIRSRVRMSSSSDLTLSSSRLNDLESSATT